MGVLLGFEPFLSSESKTFWELKKPLVSSSWKRKVSTGKKIYYIFGSLMFADALKKIFDIV